MKNYIVTFHYMVDADSEDDAVQEAIGTLIRAMRHKDTIPLTVQPEDGPPVLLETVVSSDGVAASIRREGG